MHASDFGTTAIITDPTVVERINMTTSNPGAICYMAPELLDPKHFGLTHSNPSKESDVHSFATITHEVFSSHLVARVINEHLPMIRSSRGARRIVEGRRVSRPLVLCPTSGHLAQLTQLQATGYPIKSGTPFSAARSVLHILGRPFIYCIVRATRFSSCNGHSKAGFIVDRSGRPGSYPYQTVDYRDLNEQEIEQRADVLSFVIVTIEAHHGRVICVGL